MQLDLDAVVTEHAPFVWRVLRHLGVPESQLDDLSQDVFMLLLERPELFQGRSSLRTFLYGICRNIARSARRKRRALREAAVEELPDTEAPTSQERALWLKQNSARLVEVLDELSEEQRMIFVLYEIEEVSMEEIALALEAPQRTCYSRLEAARKQVLARFRRKLFLAETAPIEVFK